MSKGPKAVAIDQPALGSGTRNLALETGVYNSPDSFLEGNATSHLHTMKPTDSKAKRFPGPSDEDPSVRRLPQRGARLPCELKPAQLQAWQEVRGGVFVHLLGTIC